MTELNTNKITRVEVIDYTIPDGPDDERGRVYDKWDENIKKVQLQLQDDDRTLKIFIS